ncbi:hypothetical protein AcW1_000959 [Taiwanofungus camphoratus]|nr:hypothetical protein AcW1_000959 [Antrodia cinnamomea]
MSTRAGKTTVAAAAPHESDARFETSAAWAQAEASTSGLSDEIGKNAQQLQSVAEEAASEAQEKEPQAVSAVNQLEAGLSNQTNAAASQGKFDVEKAKAAGASYLEQAKNLASSAVGAAQSYLNGSQSAAPSDRSTTGNLASAVQYTAASAYDNGKEYLASAQSAVQPQIEKARGIVSGTTTSKPEEVSSSTAPLESGEHVISTPYPATTTGQSTKVGEA